MRLTPSQQSAIDLLSGNLQLIACAGSGKTEVVAHRVAALLKSGLKSANIVALTFTDKAAAELKERIVSRCRQQLGDVYGLAEMYIGTIHGFCLDLLMTEVPKYLKFNVLNEVQQSLFIDRHCAKCGLTTSTDLRGRRLQRYTDTPHYLNSITIMREADVIEKELAGCSITTGLDGYRALLDDQRHFDYSAMMEAAVDVLTNEQAIRDRLAARIKHVIVNECQDVNPIQEAMVWLLYDLGAQICVVGDDDQTIYQWRGSDVKSILTFQERYAKLTEEEKKSIGRFVTLVKYKQPVVANADTIRAGEVAERVQNSLGDPKITRGRKEVDKYSVTWHTKCWQHFKIRPPSGNEHPEQTEITYCIYDKRHNDYGYTEEWVKFLVAKFKDEKAYDELFTKTGEP